jgi:hypothetical protein
MHRVIYTSRSLIGADTTALDAIVAQSNSRNTATGITGVLWSDGENFAQVLEGAHNEVGATMDRIRRDPRHTGIQVVLDRAVASRQFGLWAMRQADDAETTMRSTAFLLGFALGDHSTSAKRLYEIVIASER